MDSVSSLNKFFTKMGEQFKSVAANSKTNDKILTQLFASEKKEEEERAQSASRAKTRKARAARKPIYS